MQIAALQTFKGTWKQHCEISRCLPASSGAYASNNVELLRVFIVKSQSSVKYPVVFIVKFSNNVEYLVVFTVKSKSNVEYLVVFIVNPSNYVEQFVVACPISL